MNQLIWFCRTSDSSSLARITDSIIPLLKKKFDITLLSNKTNIQGIKHVLMGDDTSSIKYNDFIQKMPGAIKDGKLNDENIRSINMKYILVQLVDLIYTGNYEYIVICNGVYEIDWITKILMSNPNYLTNEHGKKTKLVVWAPIDYIPSFEVIKNVINADIFLTMTPVMKEEIEKIMDTKKCVIDWLGHGSDISKNTECRSREDVVTELNKMRESKLIFCKEEFKVTDTIILNANNYGPLNPELDSVENTPGTRKRLDITVKAFLKVLENDKSIKLWIHTNLKSFFEMLAIENMALSEFCDNIILSNNTITNEQLCTIYEMCNISLQTSTGEGWSLTNLEASIYRSLQVVPDFLACGYHFKDKGILIPVTRKTIKNEGNIDVVIGEVSVDDTAAKLTEALTLLKDDQKLEKILDEAYDYAKSYTWISIVDKLEAILG
jgi:glycosyltransferase involved in cell wall biosynthesis